MVDESIRRIERVKFGVWGPTAALCGMVKTWSDTLLSVLCTSKFCVGTAIELPRWFRFILLLSTIAFSAASRAFSAGRLLPLLLGYSPAAKLHFTVVTLYTFYTLHFTIVAIENARYVYHMLL